MKCKIYNGQKIADVVGYLEGYPAVFVVADRNVARFAEKIAGCRSMPSCRGIFYINATEEDKSMQTVLVLSIHKVPVIQQGLPHCPSVIEQRINPILVEPNLFYTHSNLLIFRICFPTQR